MLHPPYSPDLAPNDFFLFPRMKSVLKGHRFDTVNAIKEKLLSVFRGITSDKFSGCFRNWEKYIKRCIDSLGHSGGIWLYVRWAELHRTDSRPTHGLNGPGVGLSEGQDTRVKLRKEGWTLAAPAAMWQAPKTESGDICGKEKTWRLASGHSWGTICTNANT
ncbi:hypothetical protein LAZ67_2004878 [Cordylochernes scorpioides]|uniref:Histone-lysine N-methyltransferase SETMAR n=1 Tax=Cordylochernes scorpioides TaxID=51811 RepID=A0ABY6K3Z1_9ARAC|nr:hypothetical protein LAZ67_2004878 [Cordylochernes scorpioides]